MPCREAMPFSEVLSLIVVQKYILLFIVRTAVSCHSVACATYTLSPVCVCVSHQSVVSLGSGYTGFRRADRSCARDTR